MSSEREQTRQVRRPTARVLTFVSRAEQLRLRGQRNYSRWKLRTKGFVAADGPERGQWQKEAREEQVRDALWNQRHGHIQGGAVIVRFSEK